MNPNVSLEEYAPFESDVFLRGRHVGIVYYDDNETDSWAAIDNRDDEPTYGFLTEEEAVNWLVGW